MENNEIIIGLLARTDALWTPIRDWKNRSQIAGILDSRERFFAGGGLAIDNIGGGSQAERKQAQRALDKIEASGSVQFRRQGEKRIGWRLGDLADWQLRRLCCFSDFAEMLVVLLAIRYHEDSPTSAPPGNYVPETWLIGQDYQDTDLFRDRLLTLEDVLLPAFSRRLAEAWSDEAGRTAYSLTDEGRSFLGADPRPPATAWPEWSGEARDLYEKALIAARLDLLDLRGTRGLCPVPLSSGMWPEDEEAAQGLPPVFTKGTAKIRSLKSMLAAIGKAACAVCPELAGKEAHKDKR